MPQKNPGPDFLCVGAQKAGTGWLYEQLRVHPDFWMPPLKEVHYFDRLGRDRQTGGGSKGDDRIEASRKTARDERDVEFLDSMEMLRQKPELDLDLYSQLFAAKGPLLSGDITPGYSILPEATVRQIVEFFPGVKVVFLARDPVERAWSQLSMWVRHGIIEPFDERDVDAVKRQLQLPGVVARSFPSTIVKRWRKFVSPDFFGLYFFDDLKSRSAEVRREMIEFLGGDAGKASGDLAVDHNPKATKEKLELNDAVRMEVAKFFEDELKTCASELGGPAVSWPARYGIEN